MLYFRRLTPNSMIAATNNAGAAPPQEGEFMFVGSVRLRIDTAQSDVDVMVWLPHSGASCVIEAPSFREVTTKGPNSYGAWGGLTGITHKGKIWNYQFYSTQRDYIRVESDYKRVTTEFNSTELKHIRTRFGTDKAAWFASLGIRSALQAHADIGVEASRLMPYACLRAERGLKSTDDQARSEAYQRFLARTSGYHFNLLYSRAGEA